MVPHQKNDCHPFLADYSTDQFSIRINDKRTEIINYLNCPTHHQSEINLVSWRLEVSEIEHTYDETENVMMIDGHTLLCYFADGFCKPTTETPFTLVWFSNAFCLIVVLQEFIGRMTKI